MAGAEQIKAGLDELAWLVAVTADQVNRDVVDTVTLAKLANTMDALSALLRATIAEGSPDATPEARR